MKPSQNPQRPRRTRREQGIALVTVLAILTLTAVMVMAFFTISRSELASSTVYARGQEASQLAKTAVDMVIHQIRAATERGGVAWASQPGMIRTWGGNNLSYKLYSDDAMVVPSAQIPADHTELAQWADDVRYVDLNEPVVRTYGGTTQAFFPILDPRAANGVDKVKGLDITNPSFAQNGRLPMPVKWIYQLQDGTLGTLVGGGKTGLFTALSGSVIPSRANPIVARFAFWADDETSKLNVNTAAGGVAWDTPRAGGISDREYGQFQPVFNEFQRYPGHPATTSLIHVLYPQAALPNDPQFDKRSAESFYDLVPRIQRGGSAGGGYAGTASQYQPIQPIKPDKDRLYATIDEFIFRAPTLGEPGSGTGVGFQRQEQRTAGAWGDLNAEDLGRLQFLLTATSKAPETTVFNTPRVSVWPSFHGNPQTSAHRDRYTTYDRRLRFCAEIGDKSKTGDSMANGTFPAQYHFQRKNAASRIADYYDITRNQELYAYLQVMMSTDIPGLPSGAADQNFEEKYGWRNTNQIITEAFDYIRSLNLFDDLLMRQHKTQRARMTNSRVPAEFKRNEYYGYWTPGSPNDGGHQSFTPGRLSTYRAPDLINGHAASIGADTHSGHGQVAPIEIVATTPGSTVSYNPSSPDLTKGFGRFFGVHEVGVAILTCAQGTIDPGGEARKAVGIIPATDGEGWSTTGAKDPMWDLSNICPLSNPNAVDSVYFGGGGGGDSDIVRQAEPRMTRKEFRDYASRRENWNHTLEVDTPLQVGETRVQAILLVSLFCPSKGWTLINPDFRLSVSIPRDFKVGTEALGLAGPEEVIKSPHAAFKHLWGGRDSGGIIEPRMLMAGHGKVTNPGADGLAYQLLPRVADEQSPLTNGMNDDQARAWGGRQPEGSEGPQSIIYPWVGRPVTVPAGAQPIPGRPSSSVMNLVGGKVIVKLYADGGSRSASADRVTGKQDVENAGPQEYTQLVDIEFADTEVPRPVLVGAANGHRQEIGQTGRWKALPGTEGRPRDHWTWHRDGAFENRKIGRLGMIFSHQGHNLTESGANLLAYSGHALCRNHDVVRSYIIPHGDDRLFFAKREINSIAPGSVGELSGGGPKSQHFGVFIPHPNYLPPSPTAHVYVAANFTMESSNQGYGRQGIRPKSFLHETLVDSKPFAPPNSRKPILPDSYRDWMNPWGDWDNGVAGELDGPFINKPDEGNAMGVAYDDFIPKPWLTDSKARSFIPYFTDPWIQEAAGPGLWSPNRIMPGAGMFGSLPTGVHPKSSGSSPQPWQTLLFRRIGGAPSQDITSDLAGRAPSTRGASGQGGSTGTPPIHPGWLHPRDHYFLDFFWMPVVEPYSISEPLSTAGKVNMNYAIEPFRYIKRKTSLLGVFASEELLTVPNRLQLPGVGPNVFNGYKEGQGWGSGYNRTNHSGGSLRNVSLRSWIDAEETLKQFDRVFDQDGELFRTASQLCEMWLVPGRSVAGTPYGSARITLDTVDDFYNPDKNSVAQDSSFGLVGDNARERPYTNIVSRLTTKSNTFCVHYRAQVVRQSPLSPASPGQRRSDIEFRTFDTNVDQMVGEYRGSTVVERYIDPNDQRIPDYAALASDGQLSLTTPAFNTLDKYYYFRTVSEKRFAP